MRYEWERCVRCVHQLAAPTSSSSSSSSMQMFLFTKSLVKNSYLILNVAACQNHLLWNSMQKLPWTWTMNENSFWIYGRTFFFFFFFLFLFFFPRRNVVQRSLKSIFAYTRKITMVFCGYSLLVKMFVAFRIWISVAVWGPLYLSFSVTINSIISSSSNKNSIHHFSTCWHSFYSSIIMCTNSCYLFKFIFFLPPRQFHRSILFE